MKPSRDADPDRPIGQSDLSVSETGTTVIVESQLVSAAVVPAEGVSARQYMDLRYAAERRRTPLNAAGWLFGLVGAAIFTAAAAQHPLSVFDVVVPVAFLSISAVLFWSASRVRMPDYATALPAELADYLTQRDVARLRRTSPEKRGELIAELFERRPGD